MVKYFFFIINIYRNVIILVRVALEDHKKNAFNVQMDIIINMQ